MCSQAEVLRGKCILEKKAGALIELYIEWYWKMKSPKNLIQEVLSLQKSYDVETCKMNRLLVSNRALVQFWGYVNKLTFLKFISVHCVMSWILKKWEYCRHHHHHLLKNGLLLLHSVSRDYEYPPLSSWSSNISSPLCLLILNILRESWRVHS